MATDLRRELQYGRLVAALLQKSREGKLDWQETAEENTFLAAVRGVQTFVVSAEFGGVREREGRLSRDVVATLKVVTPREETCSTTERPGTTG